MPPDEKSSYKRPPDELDDEPSSRITALLLNWSDGDGDALAELIPLVNDDLRRMARGKFKGQRPNLLQPTALVNKFFLHLTKRRTVSWENRRQFFGYASKAMQRILVTHYRNQGRSKRGGDKVHVLLGPEHEPVYSETPNHELVLAVAEALAELEKIDPAAAEVVRLRFFVGMTVEETAKALGRSRAGVNRDWKFARVWLFQKLKDSGSDVHKP
jgi:RNA polymerase sigma factor (TIGR02999 family)